eukprot:GFUD01038265.1.p1 GENE.GFUD01038265.1~~GFUD01038265.1.p1  ORF type:complete len:1101 (-),score=192.91 GFUD01038265.1:78-3197(-)
MATPYLDLSNIYNTFSGQLLPSTSLLSQLLVSEHSWILSKISLLRPDWTERKMFLEARRIVTAEYQNIILHELMPLLVGVNKAEVLQAVKYDRNVQVQATAEGLVLGHGLAQMFRYQNEFDVGGADEGIVEHFVVRSEARLNVGFGGDLKSFEELVMLSKRLGVENWTELKKACPGLSFSETKYSSNPLIAAIQEISADDGILGSTFSCFFSELIAILISGDKFWFSNRVSPKQYLAVKPSSLSSLICRNLDQSISIQKNVLLLPDTSLNSQIPCSSASDLNLDALLPNDDLEMLEVEIAVMHEALDEAQAQLDRLQIEEANNYQKNKIAPGKSGRGSPSFGKPSQASLSVASTSALLELTTKKINKMTDSRSKRSHKSIIKSYQARKIISSDTANKKVLEKIRSKRSDMMAPSCSLSEDTAPCDHTSRYRTFSGRCNNLQSPNYGKSTTIQRRLLSPEYDDGISSPRLRSVEGFPLPNPRVVSQRIHTTQVTPDPSFMLTMMQWGQFVDHDIVLTPTHSGFNGSSLDCKPCTSARDNPACFPILLHSADPFYPKQSSRQCMAFTRSLPGQQKLGPREHLNQISHYLDGSMVYGSDNCRAKELRVPDSYLLHMTVNPSSHPNRPMKGLLPMTGDNHECRSADGQCFLAGDARVNEQPALTSFHTLLVREHNDVSRELARINPHWSNEKVFQETRKIISAIIQHITYNEFLPRVLGPSTLRRFSLELLPSGYYNDYNPKCSAAIFTEFSTAAFRFGHSMIRPNLTMMSEEDMMNGHGEDIPLRNHFNNPDLIRSGKAIDQLVNGLVMSPMELIDNCVTDEVTNHLFEEKGLKFSGLDLPALNIQRSRDHGIPGYNKYREICGLTRASSFSDFSEIPEDWVKKVNKVYHHPDDVDLFPGMLAERKLPGATVGPTVACLLGMQFRHLRTCDRFWYESGDHMVRFTEKQLQQIRGETLSGLLCRNCDRPGRVTKTGMDKMQKLVNPMMNCKDLKHRDLQFWREGKDGECEKGGVTWALGTHLVIQSEECTCTREGPVCQMADQ